jgi:HD superfamily phosphohydrolase
MITEKMLDRAMEILIDRENQAAKARAAAEHMGDLTKVVLAKLMNDAPPDLKSATARETWALAHPQYTAHLEQKKAVAEMDYTARDKRAAASAIIEAWRTECSNARAGAKIG